MRRRLRAIVPLTILAAWLGGCGAQQVLLGTESRYLLTTHDVLVVPGQLTQLRARLEGGNLLADQVGYVVLFEADDLPVIAAQTDSEGKATGRFKPTLIGDYLFQTRISPNGLADSGPQPVSLMVACRDARTPILVTDVDKTLIESDFRATLLGDAQPMPHSVEVIKRLSKQYTLIYLTHRFDAFGPKTLKWLAERGYPRAPLLMADFEQFVRGSYAAKDKLLGDLSKDFRNLMWGIGDKPSDAQVYVDHGLRAVLIVRPQAIERVEAVDYLIDELTRLPDEVQVAGDWRQVERIVAGELDRPVSEAIEQLRQRRSDLEDQADNQPAADVTPEVRP